MAEFSQQMVQGGIKLHSREDMLCKSKKHNSQLFSTGGPGEHHIY